LNKQPLYEWLGTKSENGRIAANITNDFQKVLISEDGNIIGFFSSGVDPLSDQMKNAIELPSNQ
jgi:glutathione peroxidase-family protein